MKLSKFSEILKQVLRSSHVTQEALALSLGTTQQTVSRWIKGVNEPDLETFVKICLYLRETPNSLLGFDDIPQVLRETYTLKK